MRHNRRAPHQRRTGGTATLSENGRLRRRQPRHIVLPPGRSDFSARGGASAAIYCGVAVAVAAADLLGGGGSSDGLPLIIPFVCAAAPPSIDVDVTSSASATILHPETRTEEESSSSCVGEGTLGCQEVIEDILRTVRSWQDEHEEEAVKGKEEEEEEESKLAPAEAGGRGLPTGRRRPFVTLTYAQSLDGFIAVREEEEEEYESGGDSPNPKTSSNLRLSGPESSVLTHGLRSVHDAVLVGSNTLSADNPRLNVRLWPPESAGAAAPTAASTAGAGWQQPRPVALDTDLRALRSILTDAGGGGGGRGGGLRARGLIVCCSHEAAERHGDELRDLCSSSSPNGSGVDVCILPCDIDPSSSGTGVGAESNDSAVGRGLDLSDVLRRLRSEHGIRSVMVEGGAGVLSSFASWRPVNNDDAGGGGALVDCLVVTISPNLIGGRRGVGAFRNLDGSTAGGRPRSSSSSSLQVGAEEGGGGQVGGASRFGKESPMVYLGGETSRFFPGVGRDCVFVARWY